MARRLEVNGPATLEDIEKAYKLSSDRRDKERLMAIRLAQKGGYTLKGIGVSLNRGRTTIARWVKAYREGGIEKLLHRDYGGNSA